MLATIIGRADTVAAELGHIVAGGVSSYQPDILPVTLADLVELLGSSAIPDVVVLAPPANQLGDALPLTRVLSDQQRCGVVIVADDPHFAVEAYRAGAADVVSAEAGVEEIRSAVARASRIGQRSAAAAIVQVIPIEQSERGLVVAVGSATGGVGKTTVAVNLAVGLAGIDPGKTVLVDAVPQFGGAADSLDLVPAHTMSTIVGASDSIAAKSYLTFHDCGLYIAPAPENPVEGDRLNPAKVAQTVEMLAHQFKFAIVDTPSGLQETNLEVLSRADVLLVVCDFTVHGLRATRQFLAQLERVPRELPLQVFLVMNRSDPRSTGLSLKDGEETVGRTADVVLPAMPGMLLATNSGLPPMLNRAGDEMRQELSPLVGLFHEHPEPPKRANRRLFR